MICIGGMRRRQRLAPRSSRRARARYGSDPRFAGFLVGDYLYFVLDPFRMPSITLVAVSALPVAGLIQDGTGVAFSGALTPLLDTQRYSLSEVDAAYARLSSGQAVGKVLIDI